MNIPSAVLSKPLSFDHSRMHLKTQGEMEAAVGEGMSRLEQTFMGRGPKAIRTLLIGDLLVIRLQGVLTEAEKHLVTNLSLDKGRELLKQVRSNLMELMRPSLDTLVQEVMDVKLRSFHHDISTRTGEEVVILTLTDVPQFRVTKMK